MTPRTLRPHVRCVRAGGLVVALACSAGQDPTSTSSGPGTGGGGATAPTTASHSSESAGGSGGEPIGGGGGASPSCSLPPSSLDVLADCDGKPAQNESFVLVEKWSQHVSIGTTWGNSPLVANLTDDNLDGEIDLCDTPDLIVHGKGSGDAEWELALYSGDDGHQHPFQSPSLSAIQPAVADMDADGEPEVIAVNADGYPVALRPDGSLIWQSAARIFDPAPEAPWLLRQSAVAVHDLDADGSPEVLVGLSVLDKDGALLFQDPTQGSEFAGDPTIFYLWTRPTAADLDGDGSMEVLFGHVTYGADGVERWRLETTPGFSHPADFDGDGTPEVLFTNSLGVWLLSADGDVLWGPTRPPSQAEPVRVGCWVHPAAIVDMDGDGTPEALINTCDQRFIARVEFGGMTIITAQPVPITTAFGAPENGSTAFDFRGHGPDWLAHDHKDLSLFAGAGPERFSQLPGSYIQDVAFPVVADVDSDGSADVVVVDMEAQRIRVYEDEHRRHSPARRVWNQWNYWGSNVREDLTIPSQPTMPWESHGTFRTQLRRSCEFDVPAE